MRPPLDDRLPDILRQASDLMLVMSEEAEAKPNPSRATVLLLLRTLTVLQLALLKHLDKRPFPPPPDGK
jgi:hypothetical protein